MKIAIIGGGIAGNVVAHHLHQAHDITVFESAAHIGGHTHTHDVELGGERHQIDTGFIVFNDWTYPNFIALLNELEVASQPSAMSFSVRNELSGLEYNGTSFNSLFAQRSNLLRPSFHRMIRDILRFNREAPQLMVSKEEIALSAYLAQGGYSPQFIDDYLIPMGAAIWSTDPTRMLSFPARFFVRFFHNHGMLSVDQRPQWRAICGGSARYVDKLVAPFRPRIRVNTPVERVWRMPGRVMVKTRDAEAESFDQVFFTCHSDQALNMLADPSPLAVPVAVTRMEVTTFPTFHVPEYVPLTLSLIRDTGESPLEKVAITWPFVTGFPQSSYITITMVAGHPAGTWKLPGNPVDPIAILDGIHEASRLVDCEVRVGAFALGVTTKVMLTVRTLDPIDTTTLPV